MTAARTVNGPEGDVLDWESADWRQVENDVRRLRQRIFTASAIGPARAELRGKPAWPVPRGRGRSNASPLPDYCRDVNRSEVHPRTSFTFLGYTFASRAARDRHGRIFLSFLPAISKDALKKVGMQVRRWRLHRRIYHTFGELARAINPIVAGWMQYYGAFYPSALYPLLARINAYLVRWVRNKYRRYDRTRPARRKLHEITLGYPRLFRHWRWVTTAW